MVCATFVSVILMKIYYYCFRNMLC